MSLLALLKGNGENGFGYGTTAEQATAGLDLSGKTILVTGCNSGLGQETLRVLSLRGARVIGTSRTLEKATAACAAVPGETIPLACELSEPSSVRACVRAVIELGLPLDAILCNAGIMALPTLKQQHGIELQFFTNHVGHFLLVTGLLEQLAPEGRVVMVSSNAHRRAPPAGIELDNLSGERGYRGWTAYGQSKLANLLFARQLSKRLAPGQTANALHPGVIHTNLGRHMNPLTVVAFLVAGPLFLKTIPQGAATQCWAAVHPDAAGITGAYLSHCNIAESTALGRDDALAEALWEATERIIAELPAG